MNAAQPYEEIESIDDLLNLQDTRFITALYRRLLGREPDVGGYAGHLRNLRLGHPKLAIIRDIMESDEAKSKIIELPGLDAAMKRYRLRTRGWIQRLRYRRSVEVGNSSQARIARMLANQLGRMEEVLSAELCELRDRIEQIDRESDRAVIAKVSEDRGSASIQLHTIKSRQLSHARSIDLPGHSNKLIAQLKL